MLIAIYVEFEFGLELELELRLSVTPVIKGPQQFNSTKLRVLVTLMTRRLTPKPFACDINLIETIFERLSARFRGFCRFWPQADFHQVLCRAVADMQSENAR